MNVFQLYYNLRIFPSATEIAALVISEKETDKKKKKRKVDSMNGSQESQLGRI